MSSTSPVRYPLFDVAVHVGPLMGTFIPLVVERFEVLPLPPRGAVTRHLGESLDFVASRHTHRLEDRVLDLVREGTPERDEFRRRHPDGWIRLRLRVDQAWRDRPWQRSLGALAPHAVVEVERAAAEREPTELPLRIATDHARRSWPVEPRVALFDEFARDVEGIGGVLVDEAAAPHVLHLGSLPEGSGRALDLPTGSAPWLVVGHVAPDPGAIATWRILDQVPGPAGLLFLEASEEDAQVFFRRFHRELLHDSAIDEAAAIALAEAGIPTQALRLDIESRSLDMLRPRVAALAVLEPIESRAALADEGRPAVPLLDRFPLRSPLQRELAGVLEKTSRALHGEARALRAGAERISYEHEDHGVREVASLHRAARRVRADHDAIDRAAAALARLADDEAPEVAERRWANLWLRLLDGTPLEQPRLDVGRAYEAVFAVRREVVPGGAAALVWDVDLARYFGEKDEIDVDVVFFAPAEDLQLGEPVRRLRLPRWGDSADLAVRVKALRNGTSAVRAAMYHRGHLLQSVVLPIGVGVPPPGAGRASIDYAATLDFAELDRLPTPGLSLLVNDAGGTHWVGVYTRDGEPIAGLERGQLFTIAPATFDAHAGAVRERLAEIEGVAQVPAYRFVGPASSEPVRAARAALLVTLARAGRELYAGLFENGIVPADPAVDALDAFLTAVRPGNRVLSIGLCREGTTVPWGAVYDLFINPADSTLETCGVFLGQIEAGRDLLDRPEACAAQASCPLRGPAARHTVCPFGFWGFRHEIEQPLGRVDEAAGEKVVRPPLATRIASEKGTPMVGMGAFEFVELPDHVAVLRQKVGVVGPKLASEEILGMLGGAAEPLYYFFCHGERRGHFLDLRVGKGGAADVIVPSSVDVSDPAIRKAWRARAPLVFFNGCDTVAFEVGALSEFVARFRTLGASGVVGTEVSVFAGLATEVGENLLARLARRERVGAAMLAMRRDLLRQLNPMGLAYVAYASSALHLHTSDCGCPHEERPWPT